MIRFLGRMLANARPSPPPRPLPSDPEPPTNVRVQLGDGTVVPCELLYDGVRGGLHHWTAVTPVRTRAGVGQPVLLIDKLPPHTGVSIRWHIERSHP